MASEDARQQHSLHNKEISHWASDRAPQAGLLFSYQSACYQLLHINPLMAPFLHFDKSSHWFVVSFDFPPLVRGKLKQLLDGFLSHNLIFAKGDNKQRVKLRIDFANPELSGNEVSERGRYFREYSQFSYNLIDSYRTSCWYSNTVVIKPAC